jgi:protein-disulfide isomerase
MLNFARRSLIAASLAAAFAFGSGALAQDAPVNTDELHTPGQLGEKTLGPADAKVTVVEYASMSCPHCARFDMNTFDAFKLKYIDSGKVRYIFREFPLNAPAYAAAMVARCAPADKFFDVVHAYFRSQDKWLVQGADVKAKILDIATGFGFTPQSFDACLANQALFKAIDEVAKRGAGFGVEATPTFFVNGTKLQGELTIEELDKAIEPLL